MRQVVDGGPNLYQIKMMADDDLGAVIDDLLQSCWTRIKWSRDVGRRTASIISRSRDTINKAALHLERIEAMKRRHPWLS